MTNEAHITGSNIAGVVERLKYAASKAGSIGLGEYTRVHKRDLSTLIAAYEAKPLSDDTPTMRDMQSRLDRVRHFLAPEKAKKDELQEAVDLAVNVLAVGKQRGIKPGLV